MLQSPRGSKIGLTDGDTLFFFNYRSDRMREIVSVFGLPDKPMEVTVPKDIVSLCDLLSGCC